MFLFIKKTFFIFLLLLLTSCVERVPIEEATIVVAELPTATIAVTVTPESTATVTPTAIPERDIDLIDYDLNAILDKADMSVRVEQTVEFTNYQKDQTQELIFAAQPNTIPNGFVLDRVAVNNAAVEYELSGEEFIIHGLEIARGEMVIVALTYTLKLPPLIQGDPSVIRPQIFGYSERQINLVDWYPLLVARDASGEWLYHEQGYYGENLVYPLSSGRISIRFDNIQNIPVVAASSEGTWNDNEVTYAFTDFRNFSLSISGTAAYVEDKVNGIVIRSYYQPGYEVAGQAVLDATKVSIELYTDIFGLIDNTLVSAVQGDFDDGMEYEGIYFLSHSFYNLYNGSPDQYLIMVAAHETCHQWFYGNVANDQAMDPWLDESISTYCEELFYETYYPQYLDWWRAVRIDYYQPEGKIDGSIYDHHGFDPYTNAVYRRGALFYEDLRALIGDEAFFAFLGDYYSLNDGKIATPESFFMILRNHTSMDISPLLDEYFTGKH